jgi:hypothetical protein
MKYAPRPATCGDAIEVPEMVFVAVDEPIQVERISLPGANMLTAGGVEFSR